METPTITGSMGYASATLHPSMFLASGPVRAAGEEVLKQFKQIAQEKPVSNTTRIVKVFIADPDERVPLDKRVLFTGDEKLTDATDQELFFEVPIKAALDTHNAMRATIVDKKQQEKFGKDIFLDPIKIRDLKMVVVTVAQF